MLLFHPLGDFLGSLPVPSIKVAHRMDQPFTCMEICNIIKTRPYGLPNIYYKKFSEQLVLHMARYCNSLQDGAAVPLEENKAYIRVIPKPNKDSDVIYHPIFFNQLWFKNPYKTLVFLAQYIYKDQSGFIVGRQTLDQILGLKLLFQPCVPIGTPPFLGCFYFFH